VRRDLPERFSVSVPPRSRTTTLLPLAYCLRFLCLLLPLVFARLRAALVVFCGIAGVVPLFLFDPRRRDRFLRLRVRRPDGTALSSKRKPRP